MYIILKGYLSQANTYKFVSCTMIKGRKLYNTQKMLTMFPILDDFFESTTVHGFAYLTRSHPWICRLTWVRNINTKIDLTILLTTMTFFSKLIIISAALSSSGFLIITAFNQWWSIHSCCAGCVQRVLNECVACRRSAASLQLPSSLSAAFLQLDCKHLQLLQLRCSMFAAFLQLSCSLYAVCRQRFCSFIAAFL